MMTHHQEDTERIEKIRDKKQGKINLHQTIQVTQLIHHHQAPVSQVDRIHQILIGTGHPKGRRRTRRAREQGHILSYQPST